MTIGERITPTRRPSNNRTDPNAASTTRSRVEPASPASELKVGGGDDERSSQFRADDDCADPSAR